MSTSSRVGLAGVSRITRPVSGRSAERTPSGVVKVTSLPRTAGGEQVVAAAVERPHGHDVLLARRDHREEHRAQRRHSGGKGDGLGGAFQDGDALFEACHRGIPQPLVDGALPLHMGAAGGHVLVGQAAVVHGRQRRRRGQIDGHRVHAQFREPVPAGVDRQ